MKRYVIHRRDTHEYLQEISSNWGYFCTARLFSDDINANHVLKTIHNEILDKTEVLQLEMTKWQAKEIIEGRP